MLKPSTAIAAACASAPWRASAEPGAGFVAPDARILLVDDIRMNRIIASKHLGEYQLQIDACSNGGAALHMVQCADYDMVFMDYMMPKMNGLCAMLSIRDLGGRYARLPIIALTAYSNQGAREMLLSKGFSGYLSKPINPLELNRILRRCLSREKLARRASPDKAGGFGAARAMPAAQEPSVALLRELARACERYRTGAMEKILDRLEEYQYEGDGNFLVTWLRKQANNLEYKAICKRLNFWLAMRKQQFA